MTIQMLPQTNVHSKTQTKSFYQMCPLQQLDSAASTFRAFLAFFLMTLTFVVFMILSPFFIFLGDSQKVCC